MAEFFSREKERHAPRKKVGVQNEWEENTKHTLLQSLFYTTSASREYCKHRLDSTSAQEPTRCSRHAVGGATREAREWVHYYALTKTSEYVGAWKLPHNR